MGKNTVIAERTRANLIQAFWSCFEKAPLEELTVKSITQIAGYNRSTFYIYFDNMDDLMEQAEDELLERLKNVINETVAAGFSEPAVLEALVRMDSEFGKELQALLGPWGDLRFLERLRALLDIPMVKFEMSEIDAAFLGELTGAVIISASTFLTKHPDADRTWVARKMHAYIHGGAANFLSPT